MTMSGYEAILKTAIENEMEAHDFYRSAAVLVQDDGLKAVFGNLAKDELKHRVLLEGYLNSTESLVFETLNNYQVSEAVDRPILSTTMGYVDAIALAMKKEEEAMVMYSGLAEGCSDPQHRTVFMELSKMEAGHKSALEEIYLNASCVEAW